MKCYCQSCGQGTEYSIKKPSFCSGCGLSFAQSNSPSTQAAQTKPQQIIRQPEPSPSRVQVKPVKPLRPRYRDDDEDDDEDDDYTSLPDVKEITISAEIEPVHKINMRDLVNSSKTGMQFRDNPNKVTKKQAKEAVKNAVQNFKNRSQSVRTKGTSSEVN